MAKVVIIGAGGVGTVVPTSAPSTLKFSLK